jgi:hypothetical protein
MPLLGFDSPKVDVRALWDEVERKSGGEGELLRDAANTACDWKSQPLEDPERGRC